MKNLKYIWKIILLLAILVVCPSVVMGAVTIPETIVFQSGSNTLSIPITLDKADAGLSGYKMVFTIEKPEVAIISKVDIPEWASLKSVDGGLPSSSVTISAVDLDDKLKSGASGIVLATIVLNKTGEGSSTYSLKIDDITDDKGDLLSNTLSDLHGTVSTGSVPPGPSPSPSPGPGNNGPQEPVAPVVSPTPITPVQPEEPAAPEPEIKPVPTVKADFYASVTSGSAPITVFFTDNSTGYPNKFLWNFGDKSSDNTSVLENPQHTYRIPGIFPVTLYASNGKFNNTTVKENYISIDSLTLGGRPQKNTSTTIFSIPDNAEVYLDNAYFGLTPALIENITPRNYQLRLHKDGYYDTVQTIIANKGVLPTFISGFEMVPHLAGIGELAAQPPKTGAAYIISYPDMVNLSIDGIFIGKTNEMVTNLPVGSHNLTLIKKGYEPWKDTLDIKEGLTVIQTYYYEQPYFPLNRTIEYVKTP